MRMKSNTVVVAIGHPDATCVKRGGKIETGSGFKYPAGFHIESDGSKRPAHRGPMIDVQVLDPDGKVLTCETRTVLLKDNGKGGLDIVLRKVSQVESSIEALKSEGQK